jgi:uncharacterized repeat protein (TIGR04138 family)
MSDDALAQVLRQDPRYPRAAYDFVREALAFTVGSLDAPRHVTGRELCEGIRDYGRRQFGPLARAVFASWNVRGTSDFGNLVFNLIEAGEMGKTEQDDLADFTDVYRFEDAFPDDAGEVLVDPGDEDE